MKITDLLSFPSNDTDNSGPHNRQLISYRFRNFTVEEIETGAFRVTSPDESKTWVCSSHEAAKDCIELYR